MTMETMIQTVVMTVIGEVIAAMIIHEILKDDDGPDDPGGILAPVQGILIRSRFHGIYLLKFRQHAGSHCIRKFS